MRKYVLILLLFFVATPVCASNTSGNAWSESVGYFDFSNVVVGDTDITGYAYNDNTGWLVMNGVLNANGILSGNAWSESVGYFDFSDVYISSGSFKGYAYNDNTGWLSFEGGTNVVTSWTTTSLIPLEVQEEKSNSYGGTNIKQRVNNLIKIGEIYKAEELKKKYPNLFKENSQLEKEITKYELISINNNVRDLELNIQGNDVKVLQQFLNSKGFIVNAMSGQPGSIGYETDYFGLLTQKALIKFQEYHQITPSIGYFGPKTRAFIKNLLTNIN